VRETFTCPTCGVGWRKGQLRWLKSVPVVTNYECPACKPKRAEHPTSDAEKQRIVEIEAKEIPYWYPTTPFREEDWEMWRGVHRDQRIADVGRFFTWRNLWATARLWSEVQKTPGKDGIRNGLRFVLTSSLVLLSKLTRYNMGKRGNGPVSGTLYVASFVAENNATSLVEGKVADCTQIWDSKSEWGTMFASVQSATCLSHEIDSSVDYIFTDPPFGSNIFYADCNLIWEAWLNEGFTDQSQEAVVHVKHKDRNTLPDYTRLMAESFREMYRVLKPGRWASVVFHNSDDKIWQAILDAAETAGFELAEVNAFDKEQLSFKGIRGQKGLERVTNKDVVLNLRKPKPGEKASTNGKVYADEMERRIVEAIVAFLDGNPSPEDRTLQGLWNRALFDMLREGSVHVSMAQVGELLPYYFKEIDARWYLRGDAVQDGNVFDLKSDAGAITWLTAILANGPQTVGDLITSWQQETAHLGTTNTGRLDRLLQQNFWQDAKTGRWRVPTPAEREKMSNRQSLADEAHLRVVRRFLKGELDRLPPDVELSEWLRFCYRRESYSEAEALFPHIHPERLEPDRYKELKKIVAVCRQKTAIG
jgi:hypothetical protein